MKKLLRAGCLLALSALASCGGDPSSSAPSSKEATTSAASTTGQAITLTTSSAGLAPEAAPKGGTMVRLEGHFQSAVIARRNADGTITTECHDEQAEAEAFVQGAAGDGRQ